MSRYRWPYCAIAIFLPSMLLLALLGSSSAQADEITLAADSGDRVYLPAVVKNYIIRHQQGDWVVTGTEIVENASTLLDGNLTVTGSGSLTLRNVRLTLNGETHGQYGIRVQSGGAITIENGSVITATQDTARFTFVVEAGSAFVMRDSALHGCGWGIERNVPPDPPEPLPTSWDVAGLYVQAESAILERNTLSGNFTALILDGENIRAADNTIENNVYSPVTILGSNNTFHGNRVFHVPYSGYSRCLDVWGKGNTITENTFATRLTGDVSVGGIALLNAWGNLIASNTFTVTNQGIGMSTAMDASSNNVITGNVILAGESGISIHGRNNLVEANTIRQAQTGIEVMYAYDNVIAGNSLEQIGGINGIRLTHASGNSVVNNQITTVDSDGILVWNRSQENLFQGNVISGTQRGLAFFYDSDDNTIRDNTVSSTSAELCTIIIVEQCLLMRCAMPDFSQPNEYPTQAIHQRRRRRQAWPMGQLVNAPQTPPGELDVGGRLRDLRTAQRLSIRALAELSGLNVNTLSLIENGKTSPSVSTLQQLAQALQVPIAAFFEIAQPQRSVVFQKAGQRPRAVFAHGTLEDLGAGMTLQGGLPLLVTLQPGENSGPAPIVHTGHEFVFCLEGRLEYTITEQGYVLEPGDSLLFEAHLPHRWGNKGEAQTRSLLILCPADENDRPTERHFTPEQPPVKENVA